MRKSFWKVDSNELPRRSPSAFPRARRRYTHTSAGAQSALPKADAVPVTEITYGGRTFSFSRISLGVDNVGFWFSGGVVAKAMRRRMELRGLWTGPHVARTPKEPKYLTTKIMTFTEPYQIGRLYSRDLFKTFCKIQYSPP